MTLYELLDFINELPIKTLTAEIVVDGYEKKEEENKVMTYDSTNESSVRYEVDDVCYVDNKLIISIKDDG